MAVSSEHPCTHQDLTVYVDGDLLILEGTISDEDGNAIIGTGCTGRFSAKASLDDDDSEAVASTTFTISAGGAYRFAVATSELEAGRDYPYSGVIKFPAGYPVTELRGQTQPWIEGTIHARRQATRSATAPGAA